jgi:hypothetical protein
MEEVGTESKICLYHGSTYIDKSFRTLLKDYLVEEFTKAQVITDKHLDKAENIFTSVRKLEFSLACKGDPPGCWDISDNEDDYDDGSISVPW